MHTFLVTQLRQPQVTSLGIWRKLVWSVLLVIRGEQGQNEAGIVKLWFSFLDSWPRVHFWVKMICQEPHIGQWREVLNSSAPSFTWFVEVGGGRKPGQGCDSVKVVAPSEQRQLAPGRLSASPGRSACFLSLSFTTSVSASLELWPLSHLSSPQSHFFPFSSSSLCLEFSSPPLLPSPLPIPTVFLFSLSPRKVPFHIRWGALCPPLSESPTNHLIPQGSSLVPPAAFSPHWSFWKGCMRTPPPKPPNFHSPQCGATLLFSLGLVKSTALLCLPSLWLSYRFTRQGEHWISIF